MENISTEKCMEEVRAILFREEESLRKDAP
jgi:hypothetical protein